MRWCWISPRLKNKVLSKRCRGVIKLCRVAVSGLNREGEACLFRRKNVGGQGWVERALKGGWWGTKRPPKKRRVVWINNLYYPQKKNHHNMCDVARKLAYI